MDFNVAFENCDGCEQKWHKESSLDSWFRSYLEWANSDACTVYSITTSTVKPVP